MENSQQYRQLGSVIDTNCQEIRAAPAVSSAGASSVILRDSPQRAEPACVPQGKLCFHPLPEATPPLRTCCLKPRLFLGPLHAYTIVGKKKYVFQQAEKKPSSVHSEDCRPRLDNQGSLVAI